MLKGILKNTQIHTKYKKVSLDEVVPYFIYAKIHNQKNIYILLTKITHC